MSSSDKRKALETLSLIRQQTMLRSRLAKPAHSAQAFDALQRDQVRNINANFGSLK